MSFDIRFSRSFLKLVSVRSVLILFFFGVFYGFFFHFCKCKFQEVGGGDL